MSCFVVVVWGFFGVCERYHSFCPKALGRKELTFDNVLLRKSIRRNSGSDYFTFSEKILVTVHKCLLFMQITNPVLLLFLVVCGKIALKKSW